MYNKCDRKITIILKEYKYGTDGLKQIKVT